MLISLEMLAWDFASILDEVTVTQSKRALSYPYLAESSYELKKDGLRCYQSEGNVICDCPHGSLVFRDQELPQVFNEIQKCFRFYNEWELSLTQLFFRQTKWQEVVSFLEAAFNNPLYIVDRYGRMLGLTEQYAKDPITEDWLIIAKERVLNFSAYDMMKQFPLKKEPEIIYMEETGKRCNYVQCSLIPDDPYNHVLYVLEWIHTLDQRDIHLAEAVQSIATRIDMTDYGYIPVMSIFKDLLNSKIVDAASLNWALVQLDWQDNNEFTLIELQQTSYSDEKQDILLTGRLLQKLPKCACFRNENTVVVIVAEKDLAETSTLIAETIPAKYYTCGISLGFSNWIELPTRHTETQYAIRFGKEVGLRVVPFENHIKDFLVFVYNDFFSSEDMLHPAVMALARYDAEHNTDFLLTLFMYLQQERSASKTAKKLNIHRNTLTYRLNIIEKFSDTDWDDCMERGYFLLSYETAHRFKEQYHLPFCDR